jgi:hypothetical protein
MYINNTVYIISPATRFDTSASSSDSLIYFAEVTKTIKVTNSINPVD